MVDEKLQPGAPDFESAKEWGTYHRRASVYNHLAQSALKHLIWLVAVVFLVACGNLSDIISIQIDWTISG